MAQNTAKALYVALWDYEAVEEDELSLTKGDMICASVDYLENSFGEWMVGENFRGKQGKFPATYVKPVTQGGGGAGGGAGGVGGDGAVLSAPLAMNATFELNLLQGGSSAGGGSPSGGGANSRRGSLSRRSSFSTGRRGSASRRGSLDGGGSSSSIDMLLEGYDDELDPAEVVEPQLISKEEKALRRHVTSMAVAADWCSGGDVVSVTAPMVVKPDDASILFTEPTTLSSHSIRFLQDKSAHHYFDSLSELGVERIRDLNLVLPSDLRHIGMDEATIKRVLSVTCLLYTSPSPRDRG